MNHHILLMSMDALRQDGLGCYGNPRNHTKNLDELARGSVVFHNATTPATWTLPAHMSMLSGLEPTVHGCVSPCHRYPPDTLPFPLIFELVQEAGYVPMAITGGGYMEPEFGFGRGISDYRLVRPIRDALDQVADHMGRAPQTFTFLHTYTVHDYPRVAASPKLLDYLMERDPGYEGFFPTREDFHALITTLGDTPEIQPVTPRDLGFIQDTYDAAVKIADTSLGAFMGALMDRGLWEDTTLIITSDHGESLGEVRGGVRRWHHGGPPYQDQLKIPLLIRPARALEPLLEAPLQVHQPVSLIDLAPTILDLAGQPFSRDQFDGLSLVDLALGQVASFETRRLFFHSCEDSEDRYLDPRLYGSAMTWKDSGKVIYDSRTRALREYFRLQQDPHEDHNVIDTLPMEELKRMDEAIVAYQEQVAARAYAPPRLEVDDPMVLDRLAALGYIDL